MSKPEAGQWWETEFGRIYAVGPMDDGTAIVVHNEAGFIWTVSPEKFEAWTHLVSCTGWNWVAPEQPQPAEDPDEWVIQDNVPVRIGDRAWWVNAVYQLPASPEQMQVVDISDEEFEKGLRHGSKHPRVANTTLHVFCRRRDLPKVEQVLNKPDRDLLLRMGEVEDSCRSISVGGMTEPRKCNGCGKPLLPENAWMEDGCPCNSPRGVNSPQPQKTRVRLWISALDGSVYFGESSKLRTDCEIYHDGKGFYVEEAK